MNLRSRLDVVPFLLVQKPPLQLGQVCRLRSCTDLSLDSEWRLMRGMGIGVALGALPAIIGIKPAWAGTTMAAGVDVVVVNKVCVLVSMLICVVAFAVAVTVCRTSDVTLVTLVKVKNWYHVGTAARPAAPVGIG